MLVKRYEKEVSQGEQRCEGREGEPERHRGAQMQRGAEPAAAEAEAKVEQGAGRAAAHASEHPMMVMVDESTGNKYMRAVAHK